MTFGSLSTINGHHQLRFVRLLAHPREQVWAALTDPNQRPDWFFAGSLSTVVGGEVDLIDSGEGVHGTVLRVDPGRLLEFTWNSVDGPASVVCFELSDTTTGTRLVLTHTLSGGRPEALLAGWHRIVLDDLPEFLDSGEVTEKPGRRAALREQHYVPMVAAACAAPSRPGTPGRREESCPLDGFWQVVYDDPHDRFVPVKGTWTNVSLRRSGFMVYAGGQFVHIRADAGRRMPDTWPPRPADRIRLFRTATGAAGVCSWRQAGDGWTGAHAVEMSPDPRDHGTTFGYSAIIEDGHATITGLRPDGTPFTEIWRKLSGPGFSPLSGAWESISEKERWMLLVTAGHYGVVREDLHRPDLPVEGELGDEEVLAICDAHGSNAGAIVETATSFDNHPFVASNSAGYDAAKHPSFHLASVEPDRLRIGFSDDGTDASPWTRTG